ncbi:MAG: hypothetical protein H3C34_12750 [Caldilineaceae bacterium]|nr:hypothetical protein [Caldilineaceae bacterium]
MSVKTLQAAPHDTPGAGRTLLARAWRFNRVLTVATFLSLALIPIALAGLVVDPQVITGAPAWVKPLKFAISISVYTITFGWFLSLVQGRQRWVQLAANVTGIALIGELVLITMQVLRGTASHFNAATAFDGMVFTTMGLLITLVAFMNLLLAVWLIFQRMPDPVIAWGLRLGVLGSFLGMVVAFLMTMGPTPLQLEAARAGAKLTMVGAHSVGVLDGGPGLPFLGWSTEGGDLRVPHFFGLHALQLVPLLAFLLSRPAARRRLATGQRTTLVWIGGVGYSALTGLLTWQALRAQSIVAPDALTWGALGALGAAIAAGVLVVLLWRQGERPSTRTSA